MHLVEHGICVVGVDFGEFQERSGQKIAVRHLFVDTFDLDVLDAPHITRDEELC